jgi:GT2 family glycosyltransferase
MDSTSALSPRSTTETAGQPKVAIVILNWNDVQATMACLDAVHATDYGNYSIIVVDNGSSDGSAACLREVETIDLITNHTNLGYAGGANVGIDRAMRMGADYIWLLNSDAITLPDVLGRLVAEAEADPRLGLVSPIFCDPDEPDAIEFRLGRFDPEARQASQTTDPAVAAEWQRDYPDQVVVLGTALLIRRRVVEVIGALDSTFFAYVEDVDYCLRAHAAGFSVKAVPGALVGHKFKQPVERPDSVPPYLHYFMTRNYLLLWRKLPGPMLMRKSIIWFLRQRLAQIERMRAAPDAVEAVLAGFWDGIRGVGGPYRSIRSAPWWLRAVLGRHTGFWLRLLDGKSLFQRHRH